MKRLAILLLVLAGCSSDPSPDVLTPDAGTQQTADDGTNIPVTDMGGANNGAPDVSASPDLGDTPDSGAGGDDMAATAGPPFSVPGAQGSISVDFSASISGSGASPIGSFAITDGWGTVELDGTTTPIALYERQEWDAFGYTLYQGLAVAADKWWVLWFYCQGGDVTDVYYQGTTGPALDVVSASGTCDGSTTPSQVAVDFPTASVDVDLLVNGFTVSGSSIDITPGEVGSLDVGNTSYEVYPFSHVDCTQECGTPGWHELHSLIRDPQTGEVCFVIFYLYEDNRQAIGAYAFSLPGLADPFNGTLGLGDVTWIGP